MAFGCHQVDNVRVTSHEERCWTTNDSTFTAAAEKGLEEI